MMMRVLISIKTTVKKSESFSCESQTKTLIFATAFETKSNERKFFENIEKQVE